MTTLLQAVDKNLILTGTVPTIADITINVLKKNTKRKGRNLAETLDKMGLALASIGLILVTIPVIIPL